MLRIEVLKYGVCLFSSDGYIDERRLCTWAVLREISEQGFEADDEKASSDQSEVEADGQPHLGAAIQGPITLFLTTPGPARIEEFLEDMELC